MLCADTAVHYKYIIRSPDGVCQWEVGSNRSIILTPSDFTLMDAKAEFGANNSPIVRDKWQVSQRCARSGHHMPCSGKKKQKTVVYIYI